MESCFLDSAERQWGAQHTSRAPGEEMQPWTLAALGKSCVAVRSTGNGGLEKFAVSVLLSCWLGE